jgi:8-oxo-dGTP pyrophosphatase MutT (NUDIX family)
VSETPSPRGQPRGDFAAIEANLIAVLARLEAGRYADLNADPDADPDAGPDAVIDRRVPDAGTTLKPAAVLLLLERTPGYSVVLTKRTHLVEHHKGEISLAGGMVEAADRDATDTALREAQEELGIDPQHVAVLGTLGELVTVTGFAVQPIVGVIDAGYPLVLQESEVARVVRVPLAVLRDPQAWFNDVREWKGQRHVLLSCRWDGELIWGATSRILQRFLEIVPPEVL